MYTDAYIEHWGKVYLANPVLRRHCVLFETFLDMPEYYLLHYTLGIRLPRALESDRLPLLPAQHDVMVRVMAEDRNRPDPESIESCLMAGTDCRISGGAYVEPLHHHSYAVSKNRHVGRP